MFLANSLNILDMCDKRTWDYGRWFVSIVRTMETELSTNDAYWGTNSRNSQTKTMIKIKIHGDEYNWSVK